MTAGKCNDCGAVIPLNTNFCPPCYKKREKHMLENLQDQAEGRRKQYEWALNSLNDYKKEHGIE